MDQNGKLFKFLGYKGGFYNGFYYAPEEYVKYTTKNYLVYKDAVLKLIKRKLEL